MEFNLYSKSFRKNSKEPAHHELQIFPNESTQDESLSMVIYRLYLWQNRGYICGGLFKEKRKEIPTRIQF